jgi:hypothetical protein
MSMPSLTCRPWASCRTVHRIVRIFAAVSQPVRFCSSVVLSRISPCSNVRHNCFATQRVDMGKGKGNAYVADARPWGFAVRERPPLGPRRNHSSLRVLCRRRVGPWEVVSKKGSYDIGTAPARFFGPRRRSRRCRADERRYRTLRRRLPSVFGRPLPGRPDAPPLRQGPRAT